MLSVFAKKGTLTVLRKLQGISEGAAILTARIVRYVILLVGVGVAFAFLGASVQPLLAVGLLVAAVIFLALRGISANFAAGVVLQTRHPIKVGDEIEAGEYVGTVRELNGRSVVITTRDGRTVHVPNSTLLEDPLVNHSALGHRRSEIQIRCATNEHTTVEALRGLVTRAVHDIEGVYSREPVKVLTQTITADGTTVLVQFWHHPLAAPGIVSDVVEVVSRSLGEAGLRATVTSEIPSPPLTPSPPV